jgi:hypothetical protein
MKRLKVEEEVENIAEVMGLGDDETRCLDSDFSNLMIGL